MGKKDDFRLSRRGLLRLLGALVTLPLAGNWFEMVKRESERRAMKIRKVNTIDIEQGFNHFDEFYIYRDHERFEVFSTRCTHLGCRLKPSPGGRLICPCHGSVFDQSNGDVIHGPADLPLSKPDFHVDNECLTITLD